MEDLSSLFEEEGWAQAFPEDLLALISTEEGIWSVPVNIHRSNVMWYVPERLSEWGIEAPASWDAFLEVCPALQEQGVTPLVIGENWTQQHLWESVALAGLGPDNYSALWRGELSFTDPEVVAVWDTFGQILDCTNDDAAGLSWQQATDRVVSGEAAFNIMGDWAAGYMTTTLGLTPGEDFGWAASPGTDGVFMLLSDSFGLPVGAPDRDNAVEWLKLVGSKEGQDTFNPLKGSISPRLDSDLSQYDAYLQAAAADYQNNRQVGSLVHGAVANVTFMSEFANVVEGYLSSRSSDEAAQAAADLAASTNISQ
jgi:glucose/mannose transport system substrate-binding protein